MRAGQDVLGLGVRLGEQVRRLLLSGTEQLLDPGSQAGVGGLLSLTQLRLRLGEFAGDLHVRRVQRLHLFAHILQLALQRLDVVIDLGAVVTTHDDREVRTGLGHVASFARDGQSTA